MAERTATDIPFVVQCAVSFVSSLAAVNSRGEIWICALPVAWERGVFTPDGACIRAWSLEALRCGAVSGIGGRNQLCGSFRRQLLCQKTGSGQKNMASLPAWAREALTRMPYICKSQPPTSLFRGKKPGALRKYGVPQCAARGLLCRGGSRENKVAFPRAWQKLARPEKCLHA